MATALLAGLLRRLPTDLAKLVGLGYQLTSLTLLMYLLPPDGMTSVSPSKFDLGPREEKRQ